MPFTDAQKRDIRKYLGAPMGFSDKNTRLESMMDTVGANSTDQDEMDGWLTRLAAIDTALTSTSATSVEYGALKQVDEVQFYEPENNSGSGSISLADQGRVLIDRIARALGVSDHLPAGDYFGTRNSMGFEMKFG